VVSDVWEQNGEGAAIELVDGVETEQNGEREDGGAERDRAQPPFVSQVSQSPRQCG
jgi:hypothetical protein